MNMKENVIKFSYQGGCNYIDYLIKNNKINLLKKLEITEIFDPILIEEIECLLKSDRDNIICLVLNYNLSYKGFVKICRQYNEIDAENMTVNFSDKQIPMVFYDSREFKSQVLFFTWQGLQELIQDFDYPDLFGL